MTKLCVICPACAIQGSEYFIGKWILQGGFPLPSSPVAFGILDFIA